MPIRIGRPIWRIDLLEAVSSTPGSLNRAHHHPRFTDWEPGNRVFVPELSANPVQWVRDQFAAIDVVLKHAGCTDNDLGHDEVESLRRAGPAVSAMVEQLLTDVREGSRWVASRRSWRRCPRGLAVTPCSRHRRSKSMPVLRAAAVADGSGSRWRRFSPSFT